MASLHGELAAQQRELDEGKERDQRNARQKKELNVRLDEKEAERWNEEAGYAYWQWWEDSLDHAALI